MITRKLVTKHTLRASTVADEQTKVSDEDMEFEPTVIYKRGGINCIKSIVLPFFNSSGEKESLKARNRVSMLDEMCPTIGPKDRFARRLQLSPFSHEIQSNEIVDSVTYR